MVDDVPESEHMPDRRVHAVWVLGQVRSHCRVRRQFREIIFAVRADRQQGVPLFSPMDHVFLERAAHDHNGVLRAKDRQHTPVFQVH